MGKGILFNFKRNAMVEQISDELPSNDILTPKNYSIISERIQVNNRAYIPIIIVAVEYTFSIAFISIPENFDITQK